jgi:polyphosphate kinase 2 (PPK2 family)
MIFFGAQTAIYPNAVGSASSIVLITRKCWSSRCIQRYSAARGFRKSCATKKNIWKERYRSITDLEQHLHRNGTRVIKFFLHLSKDEQRKRFLKLIDEPDKNWKFSLTDIHERKFWKHYMQAYEDCLTATSTRKAPWFVVPADDKANARLIVSQIVLDAFRDLKMAYPKTTAKRRRELKSIRKNL